MPDNFDKQIKFFVLGNAESGKKQSDCKNQYLPSKKFNIKSIHENDRLVSGKTSRAAPIVLICVDLSSQYALENAKKYIQVVEQDCSKNTLFILVGTMLDLIQEGNNIQDELAQLAQKANAPFIAVNTLSGQSVNEVIGCPIVSFLKRYYPEELQPAFPQEDLKLAIHEAVSQVNVSGRLGQKGEINLLGEGAAQVKITAPKGQGHLMIQALKNTSFYKEKILGRYQVKFEVPVLSALASATILRNYQSITVTFTPKTPELRNIQAPILRANNNNNNQ